MKKRTALITGATRGLGRQIALDFAKAGFQVALNYANNDKNAQDSLSLIRSEVPGVLAETFKADVMTADGVNGLVENVTNTLGAPDTVVINATPAQPERLLQEYTDAEFDAMYLAFVMSPHYVTRAVIPAMKEAQFGRIIHITSEIYQLGRERFTAYCSAKGGQIGYARSSASELAGSGITVNTIAPGWVPVERHEDVPAETKAEYLKTIPVGRFGTPADISHAALFFADEKSGFLTAQNLSPTGGRIQAMM